MEDAKRKETDRRKGTACSARRIVHSPNLYRWGQRLSNIKRSGRPSFWRKWITISDSNDTEKTLGIKGNCEISRLEYVHLNLVAPPEYMHAQLIDTVKLIIDAWLGNVKNISTSDDIEPLRSKIEEFIEEYGKIYPLKMHRFNVHSLTDVVKNFGLLLVNSTFLVENTMGILVRKVETVYYSSV
ncbi:hypothetical protein BLOT_002073 [Blomia tropicalis]|nr:hypothetical protein BLOT_002073 [Blomia tropicalis]